MLIEVAGVACVERRLRTLLATVHSINNGNGRQYNKIAHTRRTLSESQLTQRSSFMHWHFDS